MTIITTQNLCSTYETTTGVIRRMKKEITELDGVDLSIPRGKCLACLGKMRQEKQPSTGTCLQFCPSILD